MSQDKISTVKSYDSQRSFDKQTSLINKITDYIWPIARSELPKFLMITALMFSILCIQNLIRATKDSVISTLIGAETLSFLKFWGVMPAAFLMMILYVKLVNVMKGENIFYLIMSLFLTFFFLFAFYLFPNAEQIHLSTSTVNQLIENFPPLKWFILLLSNWSFSIFYIIAELWPNMMYSLLFWQFVNKITAIDESKRFYPLFSLLGQTGLYLSGSFLMNLPHINDYFQDLLSLTCSANTLTVQVIITVVLCLGLVSMITFWVINNKILDIHTTETLQFEAKKSKIGFVDSMKMIMSSRHILSITILLFCYGMAINLIEGPWKAQAAKIYKTPQEFASFVGSYLSYTGILTLGFVLLGSNIIRRLGWIFAAIITPLMMLVTGLGFFLVTSFDEVAMSMMIYFSFTDPVLLAVMFGSVQNVLSKSSKYTLFDSTKEMSYIPLNDELKTKGKAAAEMIGTKLGKSLSAFLQSTIFIIFPAATYMTISPYLMVVFLIICLVWLVSLFELNKEYKKACSQHGQEKYF